MTHFQKIVMCQKNRPFDTFLCYNSDMFLEILLKILSIFLLVGIGYFVYKIRLVPYDALKTLNAFVLNVAVPCLVLQSMQRDEINDQVFNDIIWSLIAFALVTLLIAGIAVLIIRNVKSIPEDDKGIYAVQMAFTNCGFMGYPLTTVLFGKYALFLAIIMNIIFTTFMYSLGVVMLLHKKGEKLFTMKLMVRMLSVPFLASIAGLIIFISGFHFPTFIDDTLSLMAATVSPVAMFIVGINLSNSKIKEIFTPKNLLLTSACDAEAEVGFYDGTEYIPMDVVMCSPCFYYEKQFTGSKVLHVDKTNSGYFVIDTSGLASGTYAIMSYSGVFTIEII